MTIEKHLDFMFAVIFNPDTVMLVAAQCRIGGLRRHVPVEYGEMHRLCFTDSSLRMMRHSSLVDQAATVLVHSVVKRT